MKVLESLTAGPVGLDPAHARAVREIWHELELGVGPRLPVPTLAPEDEGAVALSWSTADYYAEVVVHPDGRHEWFLRNHRTGEFDGSTAPQLGGVSHRFHGLLSSVLAA